MDIAINAKLKIEHGQPLILMGGSNYVKSVA